MISDLSPADHPITPTPSPPEWSSIELPELSLRVIEQGWTEVTLASDPIADELEGVND